MTDRDLEVSCTADDINLGCKAREFMRPNPIAATANMDLEEAVKIMVQEQTHRLPVAEAGNLVGVISLGDIFMALSANE